jgi:hypothetical protein
MMTTVTKPNRNHAPTIMPAYHLNSTMQAMKQTMILTAILCTFCADVFRLGGADTPAAAALPFS